MKEEDLGKLTFNGAFTVWTLCWMWAGLVIWVYLFLITILAGKTEVTLTFNNYHEMWVEFISLIICLGWSCVLIHKWYHDKCDMWVK